MPRYIPTIGLEVHVQLKTRSKMFCTCAVEYGAAPNTHTCPVCLGYPGALPVMNEAALKMSAFTGLMLGAGYSLSAISPFVLGAIRDASTGFGTVLWVLVGTGAALLVVDASLTPARLAAARRSHEPPPVAASS